MRFVQNVPFFSIMLCMIGAIITSMLPRRSARLFLGFVSAVVCAINVWLFFYFLDGGQAYVYQMGHFPAPWGNCIRAGLLESMLAVVMSFVVLLSLCVGEKRILNDLPQSRHSVFCTMLMLVLSAEISMIYTNDLFTGYVFLEIMTLSSCALISARENGHSMASAMRYMVMSLLGSGMVLLAITITYNLTGHLLMENIRESITEMMLNGENMMPVTVIIGLFFVGLGIKSAAFPFHDWLPDAYQNATPTAGGVLSAVVSKGYIILLVKIYLRMFGREVVLLSHVNNVLFVFGLCGMMIGSLRAVMVRSVRRVTALSSVAQIGYIYAALGIGTDFGIAAAMFHLIMHALCKSAMFTSLGALEAVSEGGHDPKVLRGSGYRHKTAGLCFSVSAASLTGIPILGGFMSKVFYAKAAIDYGGLHMWLLLGCLCASTLLNAIYLMRSVINIYSIPETKENRATVAVPFVQKAGLLVFSLCNLLIGFFGGTVMEWILQGLQDF